MKTAPRRPRPDTGLPSPAPGLPTPGLRRFYIAAAFITIAFAIPLYRLVRYALGSEIHSYIILIPFVSLYLLRTRPPQSAESRIRTPDYSREEHHPQLLSPNSQPSQVGAGISIALGATALAACLGFAPLTAPEDVHTFTAAAYLLFLLAAGFFTVGALTIRYRIFPLAFLVFFIPLPEIAATGLSVALQYASAEASEPFLRLTGMPVLRDGLSFKFPGLSVFVAEECSGIRSTLCLFITSVLASYLLLRSNLHRVIICALVFPLGILRNAFRITTISWLTVNVDPQVIDSALHHRGGPIFFAISLIPLFLLLLWFRKREPLRRNSLQKSNPQQAA